MQLIPLFLFEIDRIGLSCGFLLEVYFGIRRIVMYEYGLLTLVAK